MDKLFKGVQSSNTGTNKDALIKKSITTQLSNSVKEIQYCGFEDNDLNKADDATEACNALCMNIEAIFLHGLKDSIKRLFKRAIADVDERPEPSFWAPLLVISHRQIIDQITHLSQITTEVGQCRAWIRLAINDCLLSSYLMTIRREPSALKSFYRPSAYIRDPEVLDVATRLIEGVEAFKTFTIPCNSSLLNTWQLPSLYLAGIWAPTLKACPVATANDVAQMVEDSKSVSASETGSLSSAMSVASLTSGFRQMVALNEDEALKIILAKPADHVSPVNPSEGSSSSVIIEQDESSEFSGNQSNIGNSLGKMAGWSFDQVVEPDSTSDPQPKVEAPEPKSTEASFHALIESYNMASGTNNNKTDLREVWQKFQEVEATNNNVKLHTPQDNGFNSKRAVPLSAQVGKICKEKGLDAQNYECSTCKHPIGVSSRPRVCAFAGEYHCESCMHEDSLPIPARIIHNWDFKPYPVSRKAHSYLKEIREHPVIDFKILNPLIYDVVEEMSHLKVLRIQLNCLRPYLYTCREPIIEQLQKQMWPREYLYEHIHQYSISDLDEISNSVLAEHLQTIVNFGKEHVLQCWLCSQKGFVCEVCDKSKALFPFDVENIYRCDVCNSVYHKECLNSSKPCPKCKRKQEREDGLPFEAFYE